MGKKARNYRKEKVRKKRKKKREGEREGKRMEDRVLECGRIEREK